MQDPTYNKTKTRSATHPPLAGAMALLYTVLLVYGTLFPLQGWETPYASPFKLMLQHGLQKTSRADLLTNVFVYIPFGFLLMMAINRAVPCRLCRFFTTLLAGTLLSFGLEYLQAHIPSRVPSIGDLILNTTGTGVGALLAIILKRDTGLGRRLIRLRTLHILPGPLANLGLVVLGLWILSQLGPLVPSLDMDNLRHGIKPLIKSLQHPTSIHWPEVFEYAAAVAALGLLFLSIQRIRYRAATRFGWIVLAVLLLKILIVGRQLTLEATAGFVIGIGLFVLFTSLRQSTSLLLTAAFLIIYVILDSIQPGDTAIQTFPIAPSSFNWIPFKSHMINNISGILDIIGGLWPFLALAYVAIRLEPRGKSRLIFITVGAAAVFSGIFVLEWNQRYLPGRSADITDVLLGTLAWLFPWLYTSRRKTVTPALPTQETTEHKQTGATPAILLITLLLSGIVALAWYGITRQAIDIQENNDGKILPSPQELPPTRLDSFRHIHPRLPAPTSEEIKRLRKENPQFIRRVLKRAKKGQGDFYDVILGAYIEPGSQDLELLFKRLMKLKSSWRGHAQGKPLALAYDWLYSYWSPNQRVRLASRIVQTSNYIIKRIREKQKLSPYNVFLYNSPFQALMATAISTYGDLDEAELPMRWMVDYWKNRVLPVWHQVMGHTGGWHEGGEYVGIGIGQAIYQLPAMWRKATGEDLFVSEPGIRGFSDFLVYRTRPDKSHMRWGDGAHFDRFVTDRPSLALETGHKAAYSLRCPKPHTPTTWPWGPLGNNDFCDKHAIEMLPLQKYFDGIGMIIARSDWSPDATYLVFKAGDNFWSHSHLDQGAFTLFKGGPLAIDSGYYGPGYGSDHHLNYSYQSIAHNVITVTDPEDTIPKPPKKQQKKPRLIANDGGQRRIGSGWGEPAPLDLEEWLENRDTYHTASIEKYYDRDDLVVAVADLTPAYTNAQSGKGTFAHRTFRVKKYWRTLVYDRKNDLVIIYDNVVSASPSFKKRSLIHTIEKPTIHKSGFTVDIPATSGKYSPHRKAGHLEVFVLFPKEAQLELVGGKGKEFLVDGKNYDAEGKIWEKISRRKNNPPEPGHWRVEISPPDESERDRFLMVLAPGFRDLPPWIEPFQKRGSIGTHIIGLERSLTVTFPTDREGVIVKLTGQQQPRTVDLTLPLAPERHFEKGLWQRIKEMVWAP